MEERELNEVTNKDIYKHYFASIIIYAIVLLFIILCPFFYNGIKSNLLNYVTFFSAYYILYVIFALPLLLKFRPKSVLNSANVAILNYFKRQFKKEENIKTKLGNIEPKENEKYALIGLFIKTFFGVYCINLLCNEYLISMDYNIGFLKEMFSQAVQYTASEGLFWGIIQYIDDTSDMWMRFILMITLIIYTFSYLTELELFKNKIKTTDTTPLGIISCLLFFYPFTIITYQIIPSNTEELIPVQNLALRTILNILVLVVNFISLLAIARLGAKSGNLTNRGIVTGFPYNIIRHPDYAMQMFYVVLLTIPVLIGAGKSPVEKIVLVIGALIWIYLYYLRAITEERHLIKDSDYENYIQKVKYRFIPKLF